MEFWRQLLLLISQWPGSLVYHLVTVLALQVALGLALWQRRRDPSDMRARQILWAAVGILLARLLLFLFALIPGSDPSLAVLKAPLERVADAITTLLLVWALIPRARGYYRLVDALLGVGLFLTFLMALYSLQQWSVLASAAPLLLYASIPQATGWEAAQVLALALGTVLIAYKRDGQWSLRVTICVVLLAGHIAGAAVDPELLPGVDVSYWVRLANLVALPLLAVLAYEHNLMRLSPATLSVAERRRFSPVSLETLTMVLAEPSVERLVDGSFSLIDELLGPEYAAVGLLEEDDNHRLHIFVRRQLGHAEGDNEDSAPIPLWTLSVSSWPAIEAAIIRLETVQLLPEGHGARQLHELCQELHVLRAGPLLVLPLQVGQASFGVLLLAASLSRTRWRDDERFLASELARLLSQLLHNSRERESALAVEAKRAQDLTGALHEAQHRAESLRQELREMVALLANEKMRVREMTDRIRSADPSKSSRRLRELEGTVEDMTKQLAAADRSLALAAAGESVHSVSWVQPVIARYMQELEEAYCRTAILKRRLYELGSSGRSDAFSNAPTANDRTAVNLHPAWQQEGKSEIRVLGEAGEGVEIKQAISHAVDGVKRLLQEKKLVLNISAAKRLPPVAMGDEELAAIIRHALENACQVTEAGGSISITAREVDTWQSDDEAPNAAYRFLKLDVTDGGGRKSQEIYAALRMGKGGPTAGPKNLPPGLGEHLAEAMSLVDSWGGEAWVHTRAASGSTFSALLPVRSPLSVE
jgi:signal transduction histidine kinase